MKPIIEHTISKKVRCSACNGDGLVETPINIKNFVILMQNYDIVTQKLEAIKVVRFEYSLGLKVAKEMVECYIDFVQGLRRVV